MSLQLRKKGKCHSLHVGKESYLCPGMKVHGQQAERVLETEYLGDIVRADGKNSSNIKSRVGKGIGLISEIMSILKCVSFGSHYFEITKVLREARLINGILTNAEIWYSLGNSEIESLGKKSIECLFFWLAFTHKCIFANLSQN